MIWLAVVTRVDDRGVYVRSETYARGAELGPLLSAQPHASVEGPGLQAGTFPVTGSGPVTTRYLPNDTVAIAEVEGQLSTLVVLARLA